MQKEILTQLAILRVGSCANNLPWPYDWLLFCRCDWCVSGCWGKQIKTCQCSCSTDVDGGVDVSFDHSLCNISSFSCPNIEHFICCIETKIYFLVTHFFKIFENMWITGWSGQLQSAHETLEICLKASLFCGKFYAICKGIARTQSPTIRNYAPELHTFDVIAEVKPNEVQCPIVAQGEPP